MSKRPKYGNKKTVVDGITFDSAKEARRWQELKLLEKAGEIFNLERQVPFELAPSVVLGGRRKPALRYVLDFKYWDRRLGKFVFEDTKGVKTSVFRIKQHLMASVHSIYITLT